MRINRTNVPIFCEIHANEEIQEQYNSITIAYKLTISTEIFTGFQGLNNSTDNELNQTLKLCHHMPLMSLVHVYASHHS